MKYYTLDKSRYLRFLAVLLAVIIVLSSCTITVKTDKCSFLQHNINAIKQLNQKERETLALRMVECAISKAEQSGASEDNLPFFLHKPGNKKAVLLLHGFTATPWELKELAVHLADRGFSVYVPLLKGHATTPSELKTTSWEEWYASALYGYNLLFILSEDVNVAGFSMGGLLAILLAENKPVHGIVAINTPMLIKDKRMHFAGFFKYFIDYVKNPNVAQEDEHYYKQRPVAAIAELNQLMKKAKSSLNNVRSPILILQAQYDEVVEPSSAEIIADNIGSLTIKKVAVDAKSHMILKGKDKKEIFNLISGFLAEN